MNSANECARRSLNERNHRQMAEVRAVVLGCLREQGMKGVEGVSLRLRWAWMASTFWSSESSRNQFEGMVAEE